jgi:signal transduction histidine kinase
MATTSEDGPPARVLADRLATAAHPLTQRWFERIDARLDVAPEAVFPSRALLDHVPILVERIAAMVADETTELSADMAAVRKAREIGVLRFEQGCSMSELVKELEILDSILFHFMAEEAAGLDGTTSLGLDMGGRLAAALAAVREAAIHAFASSQNQRLNDAHNRLRSLDRLVSHELSNRVGGAMGVAELLATDVDAETRARLAGALHRHLEAMRRVVENVRLIADVDETRQEGHVPLSAAVAEARRTLREMAEAADVEIRVSDQLPDVIVPAAAVELCLIGYLSNAILYADPASDDRCATVTAWWEPLADGGGRILVRVDDNGIGVPAQDRERLFTPFNRSEIAITRNVAGLGLGLCTVRETVEAYGGEAWAEFDSPRGATFLFSLPCRRREDR